ncbi:MAG: 50S ribosomal protein L10 [Candidatus Xiphinematobacter sp.]|nr:MAG: 50S ribosomal protein L10 [Candidatus Xiphinematobacter sp.]
MRPEKASIARDIQNRLRQSSFLFVVGYIGMRVDHFSGLRKRLKAVDAKLHVVKNTLLLLAMQGLDFPKFGAAFCGQNALVTGNGDVCAVARVLRLFSLEFEMPSIKMGMLSGVPLSLAQVEVLATLPSHEGLRAHLLGLFKEPAAHLLRTFSESGACLVRLLQLKQSKNKLVE